MKVYTGIFTNSQVDYTDNSGNEQDIFVKIVKQPLYHMAYTYYAFGGGDLHFTFTFQGLPATATGIVISHSGDLFTWTNVGPFAPTSPIEFDLSNGTYNFIVYVQRSDGSDVISFVEDNIDLELADNPLSGRVVDTDEDKFTPIRSRAYEVRLHTSNDIDIMTFADGGDNDYLATISVGDIDNIIFTGWLSIADLRQEFQPHPNILVLTITDGLGFLRDTPLNDYVGVDFTGENKLIEYIAGALCKTGLQLQIVVENNIRESTAVLTLNGHLYNHIYLNALTFEKEIGTFEDCYSTLEKILGENCELSQQKNKWFIKRIDEFCELQNKQTEFSYDGVIQSDLALTNYFKNIGSDNSLHTLAFMNDDAELSLQRPYLNVRHDFKFEQPLEVPCNIDFSRGDYTAEIVYTTSCLIDAGASTVTCVQTPYPMLFKGQIITISGSAYNDGVYLVADYYETGGGAVILIFENFIQSESSTINITYGKKYNLDCWTLKTGAPPFIANNNEAYILKKFNSFDIELEQYAEITFDTYAGGNGSFLESSEIPIDINDRFEFGYDFRWTQNYTSGSGSVQVVMCSVRLDASDGTVYFLDDDGKWYLSDSTWSTNYKLFYNSWDRDDVDERIWRNFVNPINSETFEPAPKAGKLYFMIHWENDSEFEGYDLNIQNFTFTYYPYINGSYRKYTGQYHKSEQVTSDKAVREKQVYISDSPKKLYKGCLLKLVSGEYVKTEGFFDFLRYPGGATAANTFPYGEIQNNDVWNQYRRVFTVFEGTIDGLDTDTVDALTRCDIPDLIHTYFIYDSHAATNHKRFKLISYTQDYDLCEWDLNLVEVHDVNKAKDFSGHTFKYLEND